MAEPIDVPSDATRNPVRSAAIAVAVVGLIATVLAVVLPLVGGGAASPEEATSRFFTAMADEDLVGMAESLPPAERDAIATALPTWASELSRLGLLGSIDVSDVGAVDVTIDGLRFRTSAEDGATALVEVIAGRLTVQATDGPGGIGDTARRVIRTATGIEVQAGSATRDFATTPMRVTAVARDGGWYVSLVYTVADIVRSGATSGTEVGRGVTPPGTNDRTGGSTTARLARGAGAPDPEAAVRQLAEALAANEPARFAAVIDMDEGGAAMADADWLFPKPLASRPVIARSGSLDALSLQATGDGDAREVRITALDATFTNDVQGISVRYDGQCFDARYRLVEGAPPYATYLSCNGAPVKATIVTNADVVMRERESEAASANAAAAEAEREAAERAARAGTALPGSTTTLPGIDAFGQPFVNEVDAMAGPAYRPFDNPFSALAVFGGGADLPTFTVVQRDGRWYVSPLRTLVASITATLKATPPDQVDALAARIHAVSDISAADKLAFEARDPDNLLFGPAAVKNTPMVAACFTEIKAVVGGVAALLLFPACLRQLVAEGKAPADTVAPALLFRECLAVEHTPPPLPGNTYRRAFLTSEATRACITRRVAAGEGSPQVLERLTPPEDQPCFAPYRALAPSDPEERWKAADAEVETCTRTHVLDPRVPTSPPPSPPTSGG